MSFVLDSSAILAVFLAEPGHATVVEVMSDSLMSAVNLAEVCAKLSDRGVDGPDTREWLRQLPTVIVPFNSAQALKTGALRPLTRRKGLSLGDRACLALALAEKAPVVTANRLWLELDLGLNITAIR
jgi:PIN domain nuclease of toxin-antitoxin system